MGRLILVVSLCWAAAFAAASGEFLDTFLAHYKQGDKSVYAEKSCGVCHVSDSDFSFNPYGKALKKALTDKGVDSVDGTVLASLDNDDSDQDGNSNGEEIAAGTLPGDPTSGAKAGVKPPPPTESAEKKPASFPPKNGFHPAIVHFPIALFVGGLVLDFLGMIRKDKTLLSGGWYCLVMAAVTTLGGIGSGALAMGVQKLPYRGLIFQHIVLAAVSSLMIWIMAAMRLHRHEKMNIPLRVIYYVLAIACFVLISWAGHLGGVFVYGE